MGFVTLLPERVIPSQTYMLAFFSGQLLKVFDEKAKLGGPTVDDLAAAVAAADDWADVEIDNGTGDAAVVEQIPHRGAVASQQQNPSFDIMPSARLVPGPEDLLRKPPYHLTMRDFNSSNIEIHCSHSLTLQFLSDYLKTWARTNYNDSTRVSLIPERDAACSVDFVRH